MKSLRIFVSCGEPSGDAMVALVLRQLKVEKYHLQLAGVGGDRCRREGLYCPFAIKDLAQNGIWDVLRQTPFFLSVWRYAKDVFYKFKPEMVLLGDYPGLNLRLLRLAKKSKVPVLYLAPPQVWAYRFKQVNPKLFVGVYVVVLYAMETKAYKDAGACVRTGQFIESFEPPKLQKQINEEFFLICPGSRYRVLKRNLAPMLQLAAHAHWPIKIWVPPHLMAVSESIVSRQKLVASVTSDKQCALQNSRAAIAFPGTVNMELAQAKVPFFVFGQIEFSAYFLGRLLVSSKYLSIVNVLAGKKIMPELIYPALPNGSVFSLKSSKQQFLDFLKNLIFYQNSLNEFSSNATSARGEKQALDLIQEISKL